MIAQAHFKNFKALRDVDVTFSRLTVLVGANGVGKTTVLDGLERLLLMARPLPNATRAYAVFAAAMGQNPTEWGSNKGTGGFSLAVTPKNATQFSVEFEPQLYEESKGGRGLTFTAAAKQLTGNPEFGEFFDHSYVRSLGSFTRLRLDPNKLAAPSLATATAPQLSPDGAGLPTVLQHLASQRDGRLDTIEAALSELVPGFRRVRPRPQAVGSGGGAPGFGFDLVFDADGDVPADHVSEGTLLMLGLITAIHDRPTRLLLLDDIERGLHPVAQQNFVKHIYSVLETHKDLQVVVSTHSPDIVDACKPEDIRVLNRDAKGHVRIGELDKHPEAAKWLKLIRPGEFWSTVGEDWVAGQ